MSLSTTETSARRWRRLATIVALAYLAVVAYGVFGPSPGEQIDTVGDGARRVASEIGSAVPGQPADAVRRAPTDGHLLGGLRDEAAANVALFIPLGLLFPLMFPRWRWWTVAVGVAVSAMIEGVQLVFLSWRSPTVTDIAWNSLGTIMGFTLWLAGSWALSRRASRNRVPQPF